MTKTKKSKRRQRYKPFQVRFNWIRAVCNCPTHPDYDHYGGRGIQMAWSTYQEFEHYILTHLGKPTTKRNILGRRDVNGHYEPGNIYWATSEEKSNNGHKNNVMITTPQGPMTVTIASKTFKINIYTLRWRLREGWPIHKALAQ